MSNKDLAQMVKLLPRLKFFSVRGCRNISHIPYSLGRLTQLQSLDIRDTSITKVPKSIVKLHKLQYIRVGTTVPWNDDKDTGILEEIPKRAGTPSFSTPSMSACRRLAGSCNGGVEMPRGIGQLTALHTLGVVNISVNRGRLICQSSGTSPSCTSSGVWTQSGQQPGILFCHLRPWPSGILVITTR